MDVGIKIAKAMGKSDKEAALLTSSLYTADDSEEESPEKLPSPIPTTVESTYTLNSDESFGLEESDTPFTPGMFDSNRFECKSSNF